MVAPADAPRTLCPMCGAPAPAGATTCPQCKKPLDSVDPLVGRVINGFKILSVIGAGGMGKVYRAEQTKLQRTACIKTLLPELANDPDLAQRFEREGVATALIRHNNIVGIYDFGHTDDGILYIAMEYVEGRTLRTILRTEAPVPSRRAIALVQQILSALEEAHASGVVHRDLKPANVLVTRNRDGSELVKVVDFGIAKLVGQGGPKVQGEGLTRTGMVVGSVGYMPPEQILGEDIGGSADLYAVGVVLWELLAGRRLFQGSNEVEIAKKHLTLTPESPSVAASVPLPAGLDAVVLKALEKTADRRFQSAREFREALERVTYAEWGGATPHSSSALRGLATSAAQLRDASRVTPSGNSALQGLKGLVPDHLLAHVADLPRHVVTTEKRLLTVAYGELSGQAGLTEVLGAPAVKAQVTALGEAFASVVSRREGQLERLPGSGFLLVFGLLHAHGDDPLRAVETCFELVGAVEQANRRLPRPLQLRLGLHATTVTSAYDESSLSDSLGVAEVVAVSRRLLSTMPTGAIIASKALEKLVHGAVQAAEREVVVAGQKQEPVFELLGRAEKADFRRALVGRQAELAVLSQLIELVRARKAGGVLLVGAPGFGKSRLLAEAVTIARRNGVQVLTARGGRSAAPAPFEVARQLVQSALDRGGASNAPLSALASLGVPAADVARLERLFSQGRADTQASREDDAAKDRAALLQVFDRTATRGPVVLAIDDLHLIDDVSRQLVEELQRRAGKHPFGLVAAARPGDLAAIAPRLRRVDLGAFDLPTTQALVAALLDGPPAPELLDFVWKRSEGSPFFVEELVHSLVETGVARREGDEWVLGDVTAANVPDALGLVIAARLDRLSPAARSLLRVGAVIGRSFSLPLAAEASPDKLDVAQVSEECVQRGVLARGEQGELRFEQSLLQEVLLQRLTPIDLKFLNARIGEALERGATGELPFEVMAKHFTLAEQPRKAIRYLRLAGDRAFERGAFAAAVDAFVQCLKLMQQEASRAGPMTEQAATALLEVAGRAMGAQVMVSPDRALALYDALMPVIPTAMGGAARAEPLRQRGLALQRLSRLPEAQACLRDALALLAAGENETLVANLRSDLASVMEARGDLGAATAMLLDGLALVSTQRVKDQHLLWQYLNGLGRLHLRAGKVQPAEEFFENARQRAKQVGSDAGESKAIANLAVARAQRGDSASALALFGEAVQLAEKAGDRLGVLRVLYNRARVMMASNPAAAQADLDVVLDEARDIGWREGEALAARAQEELKGPRPSAPR
ncbi:MAG: protein kinase [Myxococcaceae bacterium]|nr:protein kinase [Myxococcaceae bacterium]